MCGIAGIYSQKVIENISFRVNKMNESIAHRGPDASNHYCSENKKIAFGHRRLSIIDLREIANQPMDSDSGRYKIVFNGEIYNFEELKKEITYNYKTESDTEVILAAIQIKGLSWLLENANGMFALAVLDQKNESLTLVRDRLGIKPLYYYLDNDCLIFSSEIKGILASGLVHAEFNEAAVDEYLANRYVRAPFTFFKNIYQVEAGTYIEVTENLEKEEHRYWDIPDEFNVDTQWDEEKLTQEFDQQLTKAIKYRLISDVPLGTYLSGGVDSSLITAITAKLKKDKINTYTIGFSEMNEFKYSRVISELYDTSHHEILMKREDYINQWENLIRFKDAPLGVPNEIPLAVMSSKLKEKITVVLSGEGADELMGGYGRIFRHPFDYNNSSKDISFFDSFLKEYEYVPREMRNQLINTSFQYRDEFDSKIRWNFERHSNEYNVFNFFHQYHVKGLLQRVDMTTMQTSVEARVPFLDHNLIEFVYKRIPYNLKLKWNDEKSEKHASSMSSKEYSEQLDTPKFLLRKVSYKYLPREIIERKKVGFPVPLTEWFENLELLAYQHLKKASWLKKGVLESLIEQSKKEPRAGQILWMFINIEIFRNNYFNKEWRW